MSDGLQGPDRQPHPRRAQAPRPDPAPAGRAARHQPERDQPDREGPPEPLPGDARPDRRRARLRDRRPRRRARPTCGSPGRPRCPARSTSRPPRTPASRCCAPRCSTAAAPRCARSPGSRRSTGCSRCSTASACRPAGSTTTTTSRSSRRRELDLDHIDEEAARRTRSIIMFLGPLLHRADVFELPYAGGCNLGTRTVEPHMSALRPFGLEVKATDGSYHARSTGRSSRAGRSCSPSAATPSPRTP